MNPDNRGSDGVLGAIGNTPLVALDRLTKRLGIAPRVMVKLEYYSPGGSIKDRVAVKMLEEAERLGALKPGQKVIELTSGNMGIGLAVACGVKGYRFVAVMSEGNSTERLKTIRALGASVVLVPQARGGIPGQVTREDLELVERKTVELVRRYKAFRPDQFKNPANALAHREGTGEEIWRQSGGDVCCFVAAVGTGGTFVGVSTALKTHDQGIRCLAVEPAAAPVLAGRPIRSTRHKLQGVGYAAVPPQWDPGLCDGFVAITDAEAVRVARSLASEEGVLSGFSGGANVAAALRVARGRGHPEEGVIVTVIPDTGMKYLSTDLFR